MTTNKIPASRDTVNQAIEEGLYEFIENKIDQAKSIDTQYLKLWQSIESLVKTGGKRLRPQMVIMSYLAFSKEPNLFSIIPAAISLEFLHLALLIHDDIIDRDIVRYGIKNVSGQYLDHYTEHVKDQADLSHYANSAAILAGDLLISASYEQICMVECSHLTFKDVINELSSAIFHVASGELIDTEIAFIKNASIDPIKVAHEKTSVYSFVAPLCIGAILAGAEKEKVEKLRDFGSKLGIAFQLRDDIIGIFGDEAITGKSNSTDIKEGKRTHLVEVFKTIADSDDRAMFDTIYGSGRATKEDVETVRRLFSESGTLKRTEDYIERLRTESIGILNGLNLDSENLDNFVKLVDKACRRDK